MVATRARQLECARVGPRKWFRSDRLDISASSSVQVIALRCRILERRMTMIFYGGCRAITLVASTEAARYDERFPTGLMITETKC